MKIRKLKDAGYAVVRTRDGVKIAGEYETRAEAFEAMEGITAKAVDAVRGGKFALVDEDKGTVLEVFTRQVDAIKARDEGVFCKPLEKPRKAATPAAK
jgi:hypothetical protein